MPRQSPGLRRISVNLDKELVEWVDEQAAQHPQGREVIVDHALRDYRRRVDRDHANPRPEEDS